MEKNKKLGNRICVGYIERTSAGNAECSLICLHSVVTVLSDSLCEIIRKWETCQILEEDSPLICI
jgi:hypothetical protein